MSCPCNSGKPYEACCGLYHSGEATAPTAEALMRSRYTAFARQEIDYLAETIHPDHRDGLDRDGLRSWSERADWQKLQIFRVEKGGEDDDEGIVEFEARYSEGGRDLVYREVGSFKKLDGRWYFVEGYDPTKVTVRREMPKVGRNDPCPCGSGLKYKKCCGKKR